MPIQKVILIYMKRSDKLTISGYINTSYNYLQYDNKFVSGVFDRTRPEENGFTLQQATLILRKKTIGLGDSNFNFRSMQIKLHWRVITQIFLNSKYWLSAYGSLFKLLSSKFY